MKYRFGVWKRWNTIEKDIQALRRENAQLEEEIEALKEAGQGILKIAKTIMPNCDFQTNNSVTTMRALLIEIIGGNDEAE